MEMDVDIGGIEDINRALQALPGLMAARVQGDGLIAAARVARGHAQSLVPVRTGALKKSLRARRRAQTIETLTGRKRVPGAAAQLVAGGKGARHAALVEYGTIRAAAQPYLEPALLATRSTQLRAAAQALRKSFVRLEGALKKGSVSSTLTRLAAQ